VCLTRTDGKAAVSSFWNRVVADGMVVRSSESGVEKSTFLSFGGCIVLGC
jgi:hypothetical protein